MSESLIAVVVIAYHEEANVRPSLLSLSKQSIYGRLRMVIVKNYAPDGTLSFIAPFLPLGMNIIAFGKNIGKTRAANHGFRLLSSMHGDEALTHFVSMDGDIILGEDTLEQMASFLDEHPKVGLVAPRYCRDPQMTKVIPIKEIMEPGEDRRIADDTPGFTCMAHTLEGCFMVSRPLRDALIARHGGIFLKSPMIYTHSGLFMPIIPDLGFKLGYLDAARVKHLIPIDSGYQEWKTRQWQLRETPERQAATGYLG